MDLHVTDEQEQLIEAFAALYAKESSPERVRESEPLGFDRRLWDQFGEIGAIAMAVSEANGGWGASMLDLVLVAEQHGRWLGSAPLIEAQVAARALAAVGPAGEAMLGAVLADERIVTFSPRPARGGVAYLVPGGAVADAVVARSGDDLVLATVSAEPRTIENAGAMPVADIPLDDVLVLARGLDAADLFERVVDEWLALMAGALAGIAQRSLEIGVEYVKEREAFGKPIGAFQAVAHGLADSAAAVDGAQLVSRYAAWVFDEEPELASESAAMAFAFATETARDASYRSLHFHGGYGFMLEYDIQLYFRRARAWSGVGLNPEQAYIRAADRRAERQWAA